MNDIRVQIKVRNNLLLSAIEAKGFECGQKFASLVGISYVKLNKLVNMTISPLDKQGNYSEFIFKLCEVLNKMPDELFSDSQKYSPLEANSSSFELEYSQLPLLMHQSVGLEDQQQLQVIDDALATLTPREQHVLKLRFGIEGPPHTLDEIGGTLGVGHMRARQIAEKALRKLRHPSRADKLREAGVI